VRDVDLRVLMPEHERNGHVHIADDTPLRDALAQLLQSGRQEGIVVDQAGRERGVITIDLIARSLEPPA
jgi:CBS domain containing-hemolysin-like protein